MSASVDSRILTMKINNQSFLTGVAATINSLANLKNAMNNISGGKGLSGKDAGLDQMGNSVDGISKKFLALSTVAITAISNITNRAVNAGLTMAKSFTVQPLIDGLHEYETNLKSTQTIAANTDNETAAGLKRVNAALDEMNEFSDKTIYNFAEMAKNVGTFTAAGVGLKDSIASIKGIANIAALSGSSSEQAAGAMYQLSQAIAAGKVGLMDWNSVVNAGMGGKKLQNALAQTAVAMEVLDEKVVNNTKNVKINGQSFRDSISAAQGESSWLTSDVLVNTLAAMDGRFSKAALALDGYTGKAAEAKIQQARLNMEQKNGVKYTNDQFKALTRMADAAFRSATESKTLGDVMGVIKESIGSGWASSWRIVIGNLKEAKDLWTGVAKAVTDFTGKMAENRNVMLRDWRDNKGREALLRGLKAGFEALFSVLRPLRDAFRDIFPRTSGKQLAELTKNFAEFMERFKMGAKTTENLRSTFRGFFAILSIGWSAVKAFLGLIGNLFGMVGKGSGGFLQFTGNVGDMLVSLDKAIKKGEFFEKVFGAIGDILSIPIALFGALGDVLGGVSSSTEAVSNRFEGLSGIGDRLAQVASKIADAFGPVGEAIGKVFGNIGDIIADAFAGADYSGATDALNVGLLGAIVLLFRRFVNNGLKLDFGNGFLDGARDALDGLTGTLTAMQSNLQSKTLMNIAIAVGVLTASVVALSLIDSEKLKKSLSALSVGFGQLLGAMAILVKISGSAGFVTVPVIAGSMVLLASSILILTGAIALMGQLKWETIGRGLAGVGGAIVALGVAFRAMPGEKKMAITSAGLVLVGVALAEIVGAVALMALLSWRDIGRGLGGLGLALAGISAAMATMGPSVFLIGPGLIAVGVALGLIAGVMKIFAGMSWEELGKAAAGLAGSLAIIAAALALMSSPTTLIGAASLLIITPALLALAGTMQVLGKMKWSSIAKGFVALTAGLLALAIGLTAMIIALPGALALLVVSPALAILAGVMATLGNLTWGEILKGLVGLAGALTLIGLAGYLLTPVILPIMGLGLAMTGIGAGFALAGLGVLAFAKAFTMFVQQGDAGLELIGRLISTIPEFAAGIANGIVSFIETLASATGRIVKAFTSLLLAMINSVIRVIPRLKVLLITMINAGLEVIRKTFPNFVRTGMQMISNILDGLDKNIRKFTDKAVSIVTKFINRLGAKENIDKFINAGKNFVKNLGKGIADQIGKTADYIYEKAKDIGNDLIAGVVKAVTSGASDAVSSVIQMGEDMLGGLLRKLRIKSPSRAFADIAQHIPTGVARGVAKNAHQAVRSVEVMGDQTLGAMARSMRQLQEEIPNNLDIQPTITPVLDLTRMSQEASQISGLLATAPMMGEMSYRAASDIAAERSETESTDTPSEDSEKSVTFNQYNYSPKALDTVTLYRRTNNQISLAKEALTK